MNAAGFLTALLHACLGFAAGRSISRRLTSDEAEQFGELKQSGAPPAGMSAAHAHELLERIEELAATERAATSPPPRARHAPAVDPGRTTPFGFAPPSVELLEFNHRLQEDLASVKAQLQTQRQELASYMTAALTDPLTGLGNRRRFNEELERRFWQWKQTGTPLTLVLVDVDHFKSFNDEYGHQAGDTVLHDLAQVLAANVREMDVVARYGGEEFGLILPGTSLDDAGQIAERVRSAVGQQPFRHAGHELRVTVSAGMAEAAFSNDPEVLVTRADMALYAAKDAGRDRTYAHDGQACIPLAKGTAPSRRKADCRRRIAPFREGNVPDPKSLLDVICEEIWPAGFTFLASERPAYDRLLVALGEEPRVSFYAASVKHAREIGLEGAPLFRVTCQFAPQSGESGGS